MTNIVALKKLCLAKIEEAYVKAEKQYNVDIPRVPVVWSKKMTSTGGTASYSRWTGKGIKITLSEVLLRDNQMDFVNDTPGHEAAHAIVYEIWGGHVTQGHGREWKSIMRLIGQQPNRCHKMVTTKRAAVRIPASCKCMTHMITKQRATKMRNGASYSCRVCKNRLVLDVIPKSISSPVRMAAQAPAKAKVAKKQSNAELARQLIAANPTATEEQLVELLRNSDIPVKPNMLKVVIKVNLPKVRG